MLYCLRLYPYQDCDLDRIWFTSVKNQPMQLKISRWLFLCLLGAMLLLPAQVQLAQAQTAQPPPVQQTPVTEDQINVIARELWCPLCSGVRLDACELKACDQMRQEIGMKLAAGDDLESIKTYFVAQYGPQVLGEPPRSGFNWLAWILPIAVLLAGALFLLMRGRKLLFVKPATAAMSTPGPTTVNNQDEPYARRLEEELKRYD
jgi:cytochrome c-type biogenesis protein CcmH